MPVILEMKFTDGSSEVIKLPAEIWKMHTDKISKVFVSQKEVKEIVLDPFLETADTDRNNNYFPAKREPTKFEMFQGNYNY